MTDRSSAACSCQRAPVVVVAGYTTPRDTAEDRTSAAQSLMALVSGAQVSAGERRALRWATDVPLTQPLRLRLRLRAAPAAAPELESRSASGLIDRLRTGSEPRESSLLLLSLSPLSASECLDQRMNQRARGAQ